MFPAPRRQQPCHPPMLRALVRAPFTDRAWTQVGGGRARDQPEKWAWRFASGTAAASWASETARSKASAVHLIVSGSLPSVGRTRTIVHSAKLVRPAVNRRWAPTLNLWPDIRTLQPAPTVRPLTCASAPCRRRRSSVSNSRGGALSFLDLTRLFAADPPVVFEHNVTLLALVEGADASLLKRMAWTNTSFRVLGLNKTVTLSRC